MLENSGMFVEEIDYLGNKGEEISFVLSKRAKMMILQHIFFLPSIYSYSKASLKPRKIIDFSTNFSSDNSHDIPIQTRFMNPLQTIVRGFLMVLTIVMTGVRP